MKTTSLHFREGNSDKAYHVAVHSKVEVHIVTFAYGRRATTPNTAGVRFLRALLGLGRHGAERNFVIQSEPWTSNRLWSTLSMEIGAVPEPLVNWSTER